MNKPIVVRQHVISVAPDMLLFLAGTALFLEIPEIARRMPMVQAWALTFLCESLGMILILVGVAHFLCWLGFRLEIDAHTIVIHRCFFYKKTFPLFRSNITVSASQNELDAWFDKGTLVIYAPGGDIITLNNLANFSQFVPRLPQRPV